MNFGPWPVNASKQQFIEKATEMAESVSKLSPSIQVIEAAPRKKWFGLFRVFLKAIAAAYPNNNHPRQMPDGRHHDTKVKRKLIGTALLEELHLREHEGPFKS